MASGDDFPSLLVALTDAGVDYVLVGGLAAVAQGVPTTTFDVDVVHSRRPANVRKLLDLLPRIGARARGRPADVRLLPGERALRGAGHQLLQTDLGALDLLGAIEDGLTYEDLLPDCDVAEVRGRKIHVLRLAKLAELKARSDRPKDRLTLALIREAMRLDEPRS